MQGLIGKKLGMTQVFDKQGDMVPVTMIAAGPCVVIQRKTKAQDGYEAVQLGFEDRREKGLSKAALGRFKKANVGPKRYLAEFPVDATEECKAGDAVSLSVLDGAAFVDVEGVTKGLGFAGVVKRFKMSGGASTHGGHSKRRVGSIGAKVAPARVHKGKRLPGHEGHQNVKQQNLKIVEVRAESNVLLVKGAVPGPTGSLLLIRKSLKKAGKAS
jgi:large subunit ribosomal protein L3